MGNNANEYSFWRWEYIRRNKKYRAYFNALNMLCISYGVSEIRYPNIQNLSDFVLEDIFVTPIPLHYTEVFSLFNYFNKIVNKFKTLPVPPYIGISSDQLVENALDGVVDYNGPATFLPGYKLNLNTAMPTESVGMAKRIAEYEMLVAKYQYANNPSSQYHEGWKQAIANYQWEYIPSKRFAPNPKARAVGVWLWDFFEYSKINHSKETFRAAVRKLYEFHPRLRSMGTIEQYTSSANANTTFRIFGKHFQSAKKCIAALDALPIKS